MSDYEDYIEQEEYNTNIQYWNSLKAEAIELNAELALLKEKPKKSRKHKQNLLML